MARVIPFRGILYNTAKVSVDNVTAPPYDTITPKQRDLLYQKSPYNIIRIDFGKEMPDDTDNDNQYIRARNSLEQWHKEGIFIRDNKSFFYAYEIDYIVNSDRKVLKGILALVKIEDLGSGIYPHEATYSKPKTDRLNLIRACHANTSPIYSLYNSSEKTTSNILNSLAEEPLFSAKDLGGASHRLYRISDEQKIDSIMRELSDKSIFIADGHHRYEVALEFKKEMQQREIKEGQWNYVMMFLANMADEGITLLPTHRLVKGLNKNGILKKLESDFSIVHFDMDFDIIKTISREGSDTIGLYLGQEKGWYALKYIGDNSKDMHPALRELGVVVLHKQILKRDTEITEIAYEIDAEEAVKKVHKRDFDAAFFLNPTKVEDMERVALSNIRMLPKSTYFYPKLLNGMIINKFGE
ncbi:DUF1015 domain-containing protein [Thermodesulfovibrionales bacterium]|nr:DUF1015 domain-containing protein [Thermodesulfovibrionales bacterium]MCL0083117.1 DUF1015 domain-containing protein [Thermodesulfovibrionales bacterium]MCL0086940.1 DUF1015 domain-containing protein [Thermodesulfovibrionales bacterium]